MDRVVSLMVATTVCVSLGTVRGQEKKEEYKHKFAGVANCRLCHADPQTGDQFNQWKKSKHAEAFKTLTTAKAKELGQKQGVDDPSKSEKCLKCHVTGFEAPKAATVKLKKEDGVGCEGCHGAGADYGKEDVFKKGKEAAVALGLVEPDEKTCVKCHNKESPSWTGSFNFEEMKKKIAHPNPQKKK